MISDIYIYYMQTAIIVYMNQCSYCLKSDIKNVKQLLT